MTQQNIQNAIAALESHRAALGDELVAFISRALTERRPDSPAAISSAALRGERRQVTVMFADISGFTAMSEKLDPEEVRRLINACFEQLSQVINRYDGHIDKFIGDEIMALFGAPLAHENDPERALRAALEMMTELDAFNRQHAAQLPKPLALHFGINTGLVIAGGIGARQRQDYSVMGDTVNLAARLEDLSEAGEILVGENSYRLTAPLFEFEALPPVRVKGKAQPVQVYRLLGAKAGVVGQIRGIDGLSSPLVGRTTQTEQLQAALAQFYEGHGSVISVVGEAGLGKSRLINELEIACREGGGGAQWAYGRALSHADSASYLVVRNCLSNLLNITGQSAETVANVLHSHVAALFPDRLDDYYPYLASLLELPLDEESQQRLKYLDGAIRQQRIIQAVRDFFVACAQQHPLVLIWEDLHWADPSSLALLEQLLPAAHEHPLLLLLIYRRPYEGAKIWYFHQHLKQSEAGMHSQLELPPLSPADSRQLLQNLLGAETLPPQTQETIISKADGNPFYLEEVIRSLIDSGSLVKQQDGTGWTVADELAQIQLPDTLQGIIMARIDQLDPETKQALQVASVIGRTFSYEILTRVMATEQNT